MYTNCRRLSPEIKHVKVDLCNGATLIFVGSPARQARHWGTCSATRSQPTQQPKCSPLSLGLRSCRVVRLATSRFGHLYYISCPNRSCSCVACLIEGRQMLLQTQPPLIRWHLCAQCLLCAPLDGSDSSDAFRSFRCVMLLDSRRNSAGEHSAMVAVSTRRRGSAASTASALCG